MSYSEWMRKNRRNIGIPLLIAAGWLAHLDRTMALPSTVIVAIGEALRIWAAGHLQKEKILTTGGPYRFIRNPLYLGSFLIAVGFCLLANSIWIWVMVAAYFGLCYLPVIRFEEEILASKFPLEFSHYRVAVPALIPTIHLYNVKSTQFSMRRVIQNKEYNAVLGILIVYVLLIAFK